MSFNSEHVAKQLRQTMREREVSQEELGRALGLSQPAISDRLRGRTHWRGAELFEAAAYLDLPLAELAGARGGA